MPEPFFPIYIDLSQPDGMPRVIQAPGIPNPIAIMRRKRGTAPAQGVQFIRDGLPVDPGAITLTYMVKVVGEYDGEPIVTEATWAAPLTDTGFWTASPSYNTDEANTQLLSPDGDATNDVPSKTFMAFFSWRIGAGAPTETEEVELLLLNKGVTGDEGAPTSAAPDIEARLVALEELSTSPSEGRTGNTVWLDALNGNDATAARGRSDLPYATANAARTNALALDTIHVRPGSYVAEASLAKALVNWHFEIGAGVSMEGSLDDVSIFDDSGAELSFSVTGYGTFDNIGRGSVLRMSNAGSVVHFEALRAKCDTASADHSCIHHIDGTLTWSVQHLICSDSSAAVYWEKGDHKGRTQRVEGDAAAAGYLVWGVCPGTISADVTGSFWLRADQILQAGVAGAQPALSFQGNTNARVWIECLQVECKTASTDFQTALAVVGPLVYLTAQKIYGQISLESGVLYVRSDKQASHLGHGLNFLKGGRSFIRIAEYEDAGLTSFDDEGDLYDAIFRVTGGTHKIEGGQATKSTAGCGIRMIAGKLTASALTIDTSAVSTAYPVVKEGGTLVLAQCALIAHSTKDSISAAAAQTVVSLGSYANKAVDSDVTVSGLLTVGSYVG